MVPAAPPSCSDALCNAQPSRITPTLFVISRAGSIGRLPTRSSSAARSSSFRSPALASPCSTSRPPRASAASLPSPSASAQ
eukprot:1475496-Rhodomonas_salina.1